MGFKSNPHSSPDYHRKFIFGMTSTHFFLKIFALNSSAKQFSSEKTMIGNSLSSKLIIVFLCCFKFFFDIESILPFNSVGTTHTASNFWLSSLHALFWIQKMLHHFLALDFKIVIFFLMKNNNCFDLIMFVDVIDEYEIRIWINESWIKLWCEKICWSNEG